MPKSGWADDGMHRRLVPAQVVQPEYPRRCPSRFPVSVWSPQRPHGKGEPIRFLIRRLPGVFLCGACTGLAVEVPTVLPAWGCLVERCSITSVIQLLAAATSHFAVRLRASYPGVEAGGSILSRDARGRCESRCRRDSLCLESGVSALSALSRPHPWRSRTPSSR